MTRAFGLRAACLCLLGIVPFTAAWPRTTHAQPATTSRAAALLFAYERFEEEPGTFDAQYKEHLDWHRQMKDPLVWYAWDIVFGKRIGIFVDGTFGAPLKAQDERVDPPGDRKHFAETAGRYSEPAFREALVLRRDLSTGTPLEDQQPTRFVHVIHFEVRTGETDIFERDVRRLRDVLRADGGAVPHTWYERIVGGAQPGYTLMIARKSWADFESASTDVFSRLRAGDSGGSDRMDESAVVHAESEIWLYRPDLSYFPQSDPSKSSEKQ